MHENSRLLFETYVRERLRPGDEVLEIGPDVVPSWVERAAGEGPFTWHTLDIDQRDELTYRATDGYDFPIDSDRYDVVLACNVLEHVPKVWVWMRELARVCRPGGQVITINPVSWPYHEVPVDCWRAYPEGMKALYDDAGLDVELSRCESLEPGGDKPHLPGRSFQWRAWKERPELHRPGFLGRVLKRLGVSHKARMLRRARWRDAMLGRVGIPVERAFDTVTIGIKR
ncbi:MAG: methyltransferase domain-containing protein [Acidobacteriota bacterium]